MSKDEVIMKIKGLDPTYLLCSPTSALEIADEMIRRGLDPSHTNIRKIIV